MDHAITGTPPKTALYGALELSKNSWLLGHSSFPIERSRACIRSEAGTRKG
jgi:hypothetical protein